MKKIPSPIGERFGRLFVVADVGPDRRGQRLVRAFCECGADKLYRLTRLREGKTTSCGCFAREDSAVRHRKHGDSAGGVRSPEYNIWTGIKERCLNPQNKDWHKYGGRGIGLHPRWHSFENFLADVGRRPSPHHSIDRPDNDADYGPENWRWATGKQQGRNRRTNRLLTFRGETRCVAEWAELLGLTRNALLYRLDRGYSLEEALTRPAMPGVRPRSLR